MMTFDEIVFSRRSIRKYRREKPSWSLIEEMLNSAAHAPSPSNSQPVRFMMLSSESVRSGLKNSMKSGRDSFLKILEEKGESRKVRNRINAYYRFSEFMFSAPYLFAVGTEKRDLFSDRLVQAGILTENRKKNTDIDISTGLALKAFILKGVESGIGTCILTAPLVYIDNAEAVVGADIRINSFITAGYPAEKPAGPIKKKWSELFMEV